MMSECSSKATEIVYLNVDHIQTARNPSSRYRAEVEVRVRVRTWFRLSAHPIGQ